MYLYNLYDRSNGPERASRYGLAESNINLKTKGRSKRPSLHGTTSQLALLSLCRASQTNMVMVAWKAVGYRPVARHRSHTTPSLHCRTSKLYTQKAQIQACADSRIVYWRMCNRLAFARHHHLRQRLTEFPCRTQETHGIPLPHAQSVCFQAKHSLQLC